MNDVTPTDIDESLEEIQPKKRRINELLVHFVQQCVINIDDVIVEHEKSPTERMTIYQPLNHLHKIGVFPGTHRVLDRESFQLHQILECEIVTNKFCAILLKDQVIHRELESREGDSGITMFDPRFFAYLYTGNRKGRKSRRETMIGNEMKVHTNQCPKFHILSDHCQHCNDRFHHLAQQTGSSGSLYPHKIDVLEIFGEKNLKYAPPGTILFGDLQQSGFVVFKSPVCPDEMAEQVVSKISNAKNTITLNHKYRNLLTEANHCPSAHEPHFRAGIWKEWTVSVLDAIGEVTCDTDWYFDRPNIIFNRGPIYEKQLPHTDFKMAKSSEK